MRALRALGRGGLLALFTTAIVISLWCGVFLIRGAGRRRLRGRIFRAWSRGVARILGMRVELVGRPPEPPFLLVANHLSYVDIVALGTVTETVFVAKKEVESWPVAGWVCRLAGTLFVDRASRRDLLRVGEEVERAIEAGYGVVVFPEGTSTAGRTVEAFRPSLLEGAATVGRPVHWAALTYRSLDGDRPPHLSVCWWGDMTLGPHLRSLLDLPGFEARLRFGAEPISASDRKVLARNLHRVVLEAFEPVVGV